MVDWFSPLVEYGPFGTLAEFSVSTYVYAGSFGNPYPSDSRILETSRTHNYHVFHVRFLRIDEPGGSLGFFIGIPPIHPNIPIDILPIHEVFRTE